MVEIDFPDISTVQQIDLVKQQQQIKKLISQGDISSYAQAHDYQKIWLTIQSESEFDVLHLLNTFTLNDFMIPSIVPLCYSKNSQPFQDLVLN